MARHKGKRYRAAYEKVERDRRYEPGEAMALVKETASTKFDETVEVHIRLGVNVRHAEEQLRGTLALPHGLGKEVFDGRALLENYAAVVDEIVRARPAAAKGRYILSITVATSMGPGVRVDESRVREAEILAGAAVAGNGAGADGAGGVEAVAAEARNAAASSGPPTA